MNDAYFFWKNVRQYQEALTEFEEKRRLDAIVLGLLKIVQQGKFTVDSHLKYNLEWSSTLSDPEIQECVKFMEGVNTEKWNELKEEKNQEER
jgi:hypothetical protein